VHIGSQLTVLEPFRAAFTRLAELTRALRAEGLTVDRLDLGGGLGIVYDGEAPPLPIDYAAMVRETVGDLDCELTFEPGRVLVGNAGILVTRVIYVKDAALRFVIVDAAMNDFLRPALYGARHRVVPVNEPAANAPRTAAEVVGPVCETGDVLASAEELPELAPGDLLSVESAGAYGAVMASTYNMRLPVAEVIVNMDEFFVIRPRPDYDTLLSTDRLPPWLETSDVPKSRGTA
jgi:diaminopimelate decarboxylase